MSTNSPSSPADARGRLPRPISADEFARMVKAGVLDDYRRVELWDGQLVERPIKSPAHCASQTLLMDALHRALPDGWYVGVGCPLVLGPNHMPDASLALHRGAPGSLPDRHLTGADVGLVIEILDPGPDDDLGPVVAAYAAGGVPALWLVDLGGRIEARAEPVGGETPAYRAVRSYGPGEGIPLMLDGRVIAELDVADLLPER